MGSWSSVKPKTNGNNTPKMSDLTRLLDLKKYPNEFVQLRFVGPVRSYGQHWISFISNEGKKVNIPKLCLKYDTNTQETSRDVECPWCNSPFKSQQRYLANVIVRDLQENMPRNVSIRTSEKKPFKVDGYTACYLEKGSKSWSPIEVLEMSSALATSAKSLMQLNKWKKKGAIYVPAKKSDPEGEEFAISDLKCGIDVMVKYSPEAAFANQYTIQAGDKNSLAKEEQSFLLNNLTFQEYLILDASEFETKDIKDMINGMLKFAVEEYERLEPKFCDSKGNLLIEGLIEKPKKKDTRTSSKYDRKSTEKRPDLDDDDEDVDEEDESFSSARGKKNNKSNKKKSFAEDLEDDDEVTFGSDDDDEDSDDAGDLLDDEDEEKLEKAAKSTKTKPKVGNKPTVKPGNKAKPLAAKPSVKPSFKKPMGKPSINKKK